MRLNGKVALITGGSRGIGRAVAMGLAEAGARVAVNYSIESDLAVGQAGAAAELCAEIQRRGGECLCLEADIGEQERAAQLVAKACSHFGGLDILVCSAGICPMHSFVDMPLSLYDRVHAVNLRGHFICCQEAAKVMIDRGQGGRIIAITSITGTRGAPQQAHYAPTKSGLHSLMQCLAAALGEHGITCNSVAPGEVNTDLTRQLPDHELTWAHLRATLPIRRIGQPEDVAGAVVFLASDAAAYITGHQIMVDGGASIVEA